MKEDLYGLWASSGGWCYIWGEGMELHREDCCVGTQAQVDQAALRYRAEYPDVTYTVLPFDPAKEPNAIEGRVSPTQRRALEAIRDSKSVFGWGGFRKRTIHILLDRGLIMHAPSLTGGLRLTQAGRKVLG